MGKKQKWFAAKRREHYRFTRDFVAAAQEAGWEGMTVTRVSNWEVADELPNSLGSAELNVLAKVLYMSVNEILILEGYELELSENPLPPSALALVNKLRAVNPAHLEQIAMLLEQQLDGLVSLVDLLVGQSEPE